MRITMKRIKNFFYTIFKFLGLLDTKKELSRTNLIIYVFIYKLAMVPLESASVEQMATALVAALGAMGVYVAKKVIEGKKEIATVNNTPTTLPTELMDKLKTMGVTNNEGD